MQGFAPIGKPISAWAPGHHRAVADPHSGRRRGNHRGRRRGLAHRRSRPRIRDSLRSAGSQRHSFPRFSLYDLVKTAPGISPTSPAPAATSLVSALGSGTNQNSFSSTARTSPARQRRRPSRAGHRLHSGTASPVGGRVRRVRQRAGRRRQRHYQVRQRPLSIGRIVLRAAGG